MERRADTIASLADGRSWVQALAKSYDANGAPAVMPNLTVHAHLYDRLLSAGLTPSFPRPKPPADWGRVAILFALAMNVILIYGLHSLLYDADWPTVDRATPVLDSRFARWLPADRDSAMEF